MSVAVPSAMLPFEERNSPSVCRRSLGWRTDSVGFAVECPGGGTGPMATRRGLVVDDEPEVRSALTDILRATRYTDTPQVEGAAHGQARLDPGSPHRPGPV